MRHPIVATIPIRSLRGGKTRLASVVDGSARESLVGALLLRTIRVVLEAAVVDRLVVVSPDRAALHLATCFDPRVEAASQDRSAVGLNGAIGQVRQLAFDSRAAELLVVFGDLPLLAATDLRTLADAPYDVTVATDRHGTGTNALRLRLGMESSAFGFAFGPGSARRHVAEAHRLGLSVGALTIEGTAFDLDEPVDIETLRERDPLVLGELIGTDRVRVGTAGTAGTAGTTGASR